RNRAGATPSKTIGSSATWASTMRRPAATFCAARRAASTSGSSGMAGARGPASGRSALAELGRGPAVDHDGLAVHERGGGGSEEDAGIGDLLDLAPAPHAHASRHR